MIRRSNYNAAKAFFKFRIKKEVLSSQSEKDNALFMACILNDFQCVKDLIAIGANPNFKYQGVPVILWSFHEVLQDICCYLYNEGARLDSTYAPYPFLQGAVDFVTSLGSEEL